MKGIDSKELRLWISGNWSMYRVEKCSGTMGATKRFYTRATSPMFKVQYSEPLYLEERLFRDIDEAIDCFNSL